MEPWVGVPLTIWQEPLVWNMFYFRVIMDGELVESPNHLIYYHPPKKKKQKQKWKMTTNSDIFFSKYCYRHSLCTTYSNILINLSFQFECCSEMWKTLKLLKKQSQQPYREYCLLFYCSWNFRFDQYSTVGHSPFASFASRLSAACTSTFSTIILCFSSAAACNNR